MPNYDAGTEFTDYAWNALYDAVDSTDFADNDAGRIYEALSRQLRFISFGDYLKRYIYRKAELTEPFESVPPEVYRSIIRQHIHEILAGKAEVNRFDLITLNFFVFAQDEAAYSKARARYSAFVESINRILARCNLWELYISDPYECFVLMCILSDHPMSAYADVWELSYGTP